jgi:hypothetical protein
LTKIYKWIKIGGLLSFIPVLMAAGPMAGYFLGDILRKKFGLPYFTTAICVAIGFITSVYETIKIIKIALKEEEDIDGKHG